MLCENIANDIQKKIESGELTIGMKLNPERILAEEYQVSRNVVREALKTLLQKGLLIIEPGKGAYVSRVDENKVVENLSLIMVNDYEDMLEVLEVREIFEMAVLRKISGNMSKESIVKLEELYQKMQEARYDLLEFTKADKDFHKTILNQVDNRMFKMLASSFYEITLKEIFKLMCAYPDRIVIAQQDHWEMLQALKKGDLDSLLATAKRHLNGVEYEIRRLHQKEKA